MHILEMCSPAVIGREYVGGHWATGIECNGPGPWRVETWPLVGGRAWLELRAGSDVTVDVSGHSRAPRGACWVSWLVTRGAPWPFPVNLRFTDSQFWEVAHLSGSRGDGRWQGC